MAYTLQKLLMYNMYSMTFSNAARNSIFTNLQLLFLEFSLMKLAISNILVVYYVETMIFLGKLSNPCVTKCCKMESSQQMYFYGYTNNRHSDDVDTWSRYLDDNKIMTQLHFLRNQSIRFYKSNDETSFLGQFAS